MTADVPILGAVEPIAAGATHGWAWNPAAPGDFLDIEVLTPDDAVIATIRADQFREDLQQCEIGDGRHGFIFAPAQTETPLRFRVAGQAQILPSASPAPPPPRYDGNIDYMSDVAIFGWVWNEAAPGEATSIEVVEDGEVIAQAIANTFRADLHAANIGDGRHGFMARLPPGHTSKAQLQIRVAGTQILLKQTSGADTAPAAEWFTAERELAETPRNVLAGTAAPIPAPPALDAETAATSIPEDGYNAVAAVFDLDFYVTRNADALKDGANPINHFLSQGWREGRNPVDWFSGNQYLARNEDVLCAGVNPLLHYLLAGKAEGRPADPAPDVAEEAAFRGQIAILAKFFDVQFYIEQAKHTDFSTIDPLTHYYFSGWRQNFDPCPWFSINDYLRAYPDIRAAGVEPFAHYLQFGKAEGRQPTRRIRNEIEADFDRDFYLAQLPPLHGQDPIDHFIATGWRTGFNPRADFLVSHYVRMNPDVTKAKINPFWHYVVAGRAEGRSAYPSSSRKIPANPRLPKLLFVGHDALHAGAEVVLLEIIRWFADHTRYPIKLILLNTGRLTANYAEYADTFVVDGSLDEALTGAELKTFLKDEFLTCYVNTVASARFCKVLARFPHLQAVPLVLHVHEMETVIREFETDFRNLLPHVDSIVTVSAAVRDTLIDTFACAPAQIFLSNAFIHLRATTQHEAAVRRQQARLELKLGTSEFVVIGCGTVYSRKGPDLFLEAAAKCFARRSIDNIKFVWIGDGIELETMREQVASRGLENQIRFIGVRDNANELIAAADVFFLSSREDPFPLVCLEAAQYGIPTVYFLGATGIAEFSGNDAGFGVPAFNTNIALDAIKLYADRSARLERAGAAARARVLEGYTAEKRVLEIALHLRQVCDLRPAVSVIVPTYNHESFVRDRLDSILRQTIADIEIIVLDDCSSDGTVQVVNEYLNDPRVRLITNERNSGGPFAQWQKGVALAASPLVWIAEGDDCCATNFLENLLPAFDDSSVNLAFCKTEIIDEFGADRPGALDPYLNMSNFPFDRSHVKMDGFAAVERGFGTMCLIVNASSAIMRKSEITGAIETAKSYKMCGDWLVYLAALTTGKLVYSASTTNFFRRHTESAVHKLEGTPRYFDERFRIASYVLESFHISRKTFRLLLAHLDGEWARFADRNPGMQKEDAFDSTALFTKYLATNPGRAMKIGFYVHAILFSKGGIERLGAQLANELSRRGHSVTIFCRNWGGAAPVYPLNESVEIVEVFDEEDLARSVPALRVELAKRDLDVFIPMLSEWLFEPITEACEGLGIPIIASEHNDPEKIEELWWSRTRRLDCFGKLSAVHLLLPRFAASLPKEFKNKTFIIPNGVEPTKLNPAPGHGERPPRIIGVGRLEAQKRFDRLINGFALAAADLPGWRLDIFGEGSQRQILQRLIDDHGLGDRIALRGLTANVPQELRQSSLFVLPSCFEGFGIVVLEAQQAGLPCIAYASCNGPNDLIAHDTDGMLVADDETGQSIAASLSALAADPGRRRAMGEAAQDAAAGYDMSGIVTQWEKMILAVLRRDFERKLSISTVPPGARRPEVDLRVVSG
jgi:glycosyltransferase involved in cell wall biosynthesis